MSTLVTYCSWKKDSDPNPLPAKQRYISSRIKRIVAVAEQTRSPLYFLSAKYGLIGSHAPIQDYDQKLGTDLAELLPVAQKTAEIIKGWAPLHRFVFVADPTDDGAIPYLTVMTKAALLAGAFVTVVSVDTLERSLCLRFGDI